MLSFKGQRDDLRRLEASLPECFLIRTHPNPLVLSSKNVNAISISSNRKYLHHQNFKHRLTYNPYARQQVPFNWKNKILNLFNLPFRKYYLLIFFHFDCSNIHPPAMPSTSHPRVSTIPNPTNFSYQKFYLV